MWIRGLTLSFLFNHRFSFLCLLSLLTGGLWLVHGIGIIVSPLIIIILKQERDKVRRFLLAWIYFAIGSLGLIDAYQQYFHIHTFSVIAVLIWSACACLLALPWCGYSQFPHLLGILLIEALPPMGLIGWLSPLSSLGYWFPGTRYWGLIFGLILLYCCDKKHLSGMVILVFIAMALNLTYRPPTTPNNWLGVNTSLSPNDSLISLEESLQHIIASTPSDKNRLVLPESILPNWFYGTRLWTEKNLSNQLSLLMGTTTWQNHQPVDAIVLIDHGQALTEPVFSSVFPVPVSMWNPFKKRSYQASWWPTSFILDHMRINAIICYDQLLVWPWLSFFITRPTLIIALSNEWWATSSLIPDIQTQSRYAWARLLNIPLISARNISLSSSHCCRVKD
ncbi:MAG: hypothetical protein KGN31_06265 [Betaproteobacteria bacterium]|nr:hypothetical protein [Betaproteobacteria bacterium]